MGYLRFWRRKNILPGVRLNFGKRGISASVGPKGAHLTVGRKPRATVGIPGSGLFYTWTKNKQSGVPGSPDNLGQVASNKGKWWKGCGCLAAILIFIAILAGNSSNNGNSTAGQATPSISASASLGNPSETTPPVVAATPTQTAVPSVPATVPATPVPTNGAPPGATALCNDGTYSFSTSRSGTCSHHGGVKQWL